MSTFHEGWWAVLSALRREVWKAANGDVDREPLLSSAQKFVEFGVANEALLNGLSAARPAVEAFQHALGRPNPESQSAVERLSALVALVSSLDNALMEVNAVETKGVTTNTVNVVQSTVQTVQVGETNSQTISFATSMETLIDDSPAPTTQKEEAKSLLRRFVEHPLINTLLGAGLSGMR